MQSLTGGPDVEIQWGERSGDVQLGAVVETLGLLWWKQTVLCVFVRNSGEELLSIIETDPRSDYHVVLTHPDGRLEERVPPPQPEEGRERSRMLVVTLAPGEEHESRIPLSKWFDLGRPGTYKVKVGTAVSEERRLAFSAEVTFEV